MVSSSLEPPMSARQASLDGQQPMVVIGIGEDVVAHDRDIVPPGPGSRQGYELPAIVQHDHDDDEQER